MKSKDLHLFYVEGWQFGRVPLVIFSEYKGIITKVNIHPHEALISEYRNYFHGYCDGADAPGDVINVTVIDKETFKKEYGSLDASLYEMFEEYIGVNI